MRKLLIELQRRKDAKENPCDSCNGQGGENNRVCVDCLGQGILLTQKEYAEILKRAGYDLSKLDDDEILDAETLEL